MEEDSSMTVAWCQKGVGLWSFRLLALWREARMHRALEVVSRLDSNQQPPRHFGVLCH